MTKRWVVMAGLLVIGLMTISIRADGRISGNDDKDAVKNNGLYHGVPLDELWIDQAMEGRNSHLIKTGGSSPTGIDLIRAEKFPGLSRAVSDSVIRSWIRQDTTIPSLEGARAIDMVLDSAGNCYVTGNCFVPGNQSDIFTIKYDHTGNRIWMASFNGQDHESDGAQRIAIDPAGNIYVAGNTITEASLQDYVVIKYNPSGEQEWVAIYNGPGNAVDSPQDMVVDDSGNVFITGYSRGSGTNDDYATLKYDSDGNLKWSVRYNSPNDSTDSPNAIALDQNGHVYVTGRSVGDGTDDDIATVKYDAAGQELWRARYNNPENSGDYPYDMVVDTQGSVYVSGSDRGDFLTLKYDTNGNQLWTAYFDGSSHSPDQIEAMALDRAGNVYVTGFAKNQETGIDFVTIKYDTAGQQVWMAQYSGSGYGDDYPTCMTVDSACNLYVSGYSMGPSITGMDLVTIKYDSSGNTMWESRFTDTRYGINYPVRNGVDRDGNVIVAGLGSSYEMGKVCRTIMYDLAGNQVWEKTFSGAGYRSTYYCSMQLTPAGHVAVAVASYGKGGGTNCMTQLYDSKGKKLWQAWYDGPTHSHDHPTDLAVDQDGNVCITGTSYGTDNNDCITIKYSPSGEELWAARYNGPADSSDQASAITVDSAGQFYVTGYSHHPDSHYDMLTVKYSSSGQELWSVVYNGTGDSSDYGRGIAVDPSGSVYVAGESWGSDGNSDLAVVKYTPEGEMAWEKRYSIASNTYEKTIDLKLDSEGNPYVAGYSLDNRYFALKLNPEGEIVWSVVPEFSGILSSMTLDSSGQLYLTGSAYINSDHGDYAVVKLDSNGQILWQRFSDWRGNAVFVNLYAVTLDNHGDAYLTGKMHWPGLFESDLLTVKYSAAGELKWVKTTDVSGDNNAYARSIVVDQENNVYIAGWIEYEKLPLCLFVQKYRQIMTDVGEPVLPSGLVFALDPAYPNPFNPTTVISFSLPVASPVSLKIYDMLGREVAKLFSDNLPAGNHSVQWKAQGMANGIYFYRLQAGAQTQTRKMTLLK